MIFSFVKKIINFLIPISKNKLLINGLNNTIINNNAVLSSVVFDISGNNNYIEIKAGCIVKNVIFRIRGNGHRIIIGAFCRFNQGSTIWIEDSDCALIVGEKTTFENVHLAITEPGSKITIGKDCMLSNDIDIRTGDSHSILSIKNHERINYAKDIIIGNHVWIASHCIILKGVCISDNSVIASGSVVTNSFDEEGSIIAGNPARQVKSGIIWTRERIYDKK